MLGRHELLSLRLPTCEWEYERDFTRSAAPIEAQKTAERVYRHIESAWLKPRDAQ